MLSNFLLTMLALMSAFLIFALIAVWNRFKEIEKEESTAPNYSIFTDQISP